MEAIKTEWFKDIKNRYIFYLGVLSVMLLYISLIHFDTFLDKCSAIRTQNDTCWILVMDNEGNGFGTITDRCIQLKNNCESSNHNIPCKWFGEEGIQSTNGENLKGCKCELYEIFDWAEPELNNQSLSYSTT